MKPPIIEGIKLTCSDCNSEFRWVPTSTIKPKRCPRCQNLADFQRKQDSANKIAENKKVLKNAGFYAKKEKLKKTGKTEFGTRRKTWKDKDLPMLINHVQSRICNPYIRERDKTLFGKCISCNSGINQAGHRYCIKDFPGMRFMVENIHGQEISCNHHKSGNVDFYDRGLTLRHGEEYLANLKRKAELYLRGGFHFSRYDVVKIGETYQYLHKNKIWVFTSEEFNHYRDVIQ